MKNRIKNPRHAVSVSYHANFLEVDGTVRDSMGERLKSLAFVGYYCDEEECPDNYEEECPLHPGEYWLDLAAAHWVRDAEDNGETVVWGDE